MAKVGRKANHFATEDGRVIEGLSKSSDGRFRPVGIASVTFGRDEAQAIHRFRVWQSKQSNIEPLDDDGGIHSGINKKIDAIGLRLIVS